MTDDEQKWLDNEQRWLAAIDPQLISDNAHRIYDFMRDDGIDPDSWTREQAFTKAAKALSIDYEVLYTAWLDGRPVN